MAKENNAANEENDNIIILTDEEGKDAKFEFLCKVELNGNEYCAFIPLDDDEVDEDSYVILKLVKDEKGEEMLVTVDDDDEFDDACDAIEDTLFSDIDYDN